MSRQSIFPDVSSKLKLALEMSPLAIILSDENGTIIVANKETENLFGYTKRELIGQSIDLLVPHKVRHQHATERGVFFAEPKKRPMGMGRDLYAQTKEGKVIPVEIGLNPIRTDQGRFVLATLADISQRLKKEEKLQQREQELQEEKLRVKDRLLFHISHELRSPLTTIHHFLTIINDGLAGKTTDDQQKYLGIALRNVNDLSSMIHSLVESTQVETGKLEITPRVISPKTITKEIADEFKVRCQKAGVNLKSEIDPKLPSIYADPHRLRQVLANLLTNALKYTPKEGAISVSVQKSRKEKEMILFSVKDSGCGIKNEELENIFSRLYQSRNTIKPTRRGLGLGLYLCHKIITRQQGKIWAESELEKGSSFFFTIPTYTVQKVIQPILIKDGKLVPAIALISVKLNWPAKEISTKERNLLLAEVQDFLQGCTLRSLDVILPKAHAKIGQSIFFIVGQTDQLGAKAMIQRIKEQVPYHDGIRKFQVKLKTSFSMLDLKEIKDHSDLTTDQQLDSVVSKLDDLIKQKIIKEEK